MSIDAGRPSTVVNMWSGPRNISTALMYSWRQRHDTTVFDEPFYGIYLRQHDPGHPGREEIIESMPLTEQETLDGLIEPGRPIRYIKNICHHLDSIEESILDRFTNVLLIREPSRVLASLSATMGPDFAIEITGLRQQVRILEHELAAGREPIVLDSADLLSQPRSALSALCRRLGLPFDDAMLAWPSGPKPEDGLWAKFWYHSSHASTGFAPPASTRPEPAEPHHLLAECQPMYDRIARHRFTP